MNFELAKRITLAGATATEEFGASADRMLSQAKARIAILDSLLAEGRSLRWGSHSATETGGAARKVDHGSARQTLALFGGARADSEKPGKFFNFAISASGLSHEDLILENASGVKISQGIPAVMVDGFLPPGIHLTTWDQFVNHYGNDPNRSKFFSGMLHGMHDLRGEGVNDAYLGGSFVTSKVQPGDFDMSYPTKFGFGADVIDNRVLRDRSMMKEAFGGEFFADHEKFFQQNIRANKTGIGILHFDLRELPPRPSPISPGEEVLRKHDRREQIMAERRRTMLISSVESPVLWAFNGELKPFATALHNRLRSPLLELPPNNAWNLERISSEKLARFKNDAAPARPSPPLADPFPVVSGTDMASAPKTGSFDALLKPILQIPLRLKSGISRPAMFHATVDQSSPFIRGNPIEDFLAVNDSGFTISRFNPNELGSSRTAANRFGDTSQFAFKRGKNELASRPWLH